MIDIRALSKIGMFTYDPAFLSTASCASNITFIDGDAGLLYYRGYPIEQLAEKSDFLEVCYLLMNGDLPDAAQKAEFNHKVTQHTTPTITAIGCASRRKPLKKRAIWSCTMVC